MGPTLSPEQNRKRVIGSGRRKGDYKRLQGKRGNQSLIPMLCNTQKELKKGGNTKGVEARGKR